MFRKSIVVFVGLLFASAAIAGPGFINGLAIPGDMGDQYGTDVNDGRLGFFSDLYYDPIRGEWWGLSDRGAGGGTLPYDTRVQRFTIDIDPITGAISNFQVVETIKFTDGGSHRTMNGQARPIQVTCSATPSIPRASSSVPKTVTSWCRTSTARHSMSSTAEGSSSEPLPHLSI